METFIAPIWRGEYDAPLRNMHPSLRDKVDAPYFEAALAQLHHTLGDCGGTVCMHIKEGVRNVHGQAVRDEARVLKFGNGRRVHFRLEWVKGQLSSISIAAADGLPLDLHPSELTSVDLFVQRGVELLAAWYQTEDVSKLLHPALVDAAGGIEGLQALQLSARAADASAVASIEPQQPTTTLLLGDEGDGVPQMSLAFLVRRYHTAQSATITWSFPTWRGEVTGFSLLTDPTPDRSPTTHKWREPRSPVLCSSC
eukprot:GGOE01025806.1.p1 GENE.GGOE01025806.1~~GGOE01025806.1.p1  ORF type:complete len:274 (+),score=71.33 GGOE01025806.1:63-824(+)